MRLKKTSPEYQLAQMFWRNGYMRTPNLERRESDILRKYKKGYEVRLVATDEKELKQIRAWLGQSGFAGGAPFMKAKQFVQPIYGRAAWEQFKEILAKAHKTREYEGQDLSLAPRRQRRTVT